SPSDLFEISAGITRYYVGSGRMAEGFDPASLGFPASTTALFSGFKYFPSFAPSGYGTVGASGGDFQADNTFFIQGAYTKTKGKHSLHTGYDVRAYRENTLPTNRPDGFDTTSASPIEAAARAAYAAKPDPALAATDFHIRGGLLFADSSQRRFWDTRAAMFQPRAGFALQLDSRTVLRGGFGMYMIPFG